MTWTHLAKELLKGGLVLLALVAAFALWIGMLAYLRHSDCDRLDEVRVSYLEPGHDTAGPGSIYVKGVGPGPPPSQIMPYLEAVAAMESAGCDVPGDD